MGEKEWQELLRSLMVERFGKVPPRPETPAQKKKRIEQIVNDVTGPAPKKEK